MNEDQYRRLKREVEQAKAEAERAQGALEQLMKRLKEEFECEDIKSAKKLLAELQEKKEKAERAFDRALKDYELKWKNQ